MGCQELGFRFRALALGLAVVLLAGPGAVTARAQSTRLAYQGRLTESGLPASGSYAMQFRLFDTASVGTGTRQGDEIEVPAVTVAEGTFTTLLEFGLDVFDGSPRYLEISVRRAGSAAPWSTLDPRQAITPVPYALRTLSATPVSDTLQNDGSGNVALGTNVFPPGVRLHVAGATRFSPGGSGGTVQVGSPNGETGLTISGPNRADLRFSRDTLTLAAGANGGPPPPWNGITLNTNGNVGLGLAALATTSLWKLEVNGPTRVTPAGAAGGAIQFSTPNGETGMSILGRNRADLRFDDTTLKLVAGTGTGTPSGLNGLTLDLNGHVGIGTSTPSQTLSVAGSASVSDRLQVGPVILPKARLHVESDTQPAVRAESTVRDTPALLASGQTHGLALHADGHVTQGLLNGGFVKAMFHFANGKIERCFSGVATEPNPAALTRGNCGIQITGREGDSYRDWTYIDLGFPVADRFVVVTPHLRTERMAVANVYLAPRGNTHEIAVVVGMSNGDENGADAGLPFTVVVF